MICLRREEQLVLSLYLENSLFPLDGKDVLLTLTADEVTDLLVFGLFSGTLVVLWTLAQELLLNKIDT